MARDIGVRSVAIGGDRLFVDSVDRWLAAWTRKLRLHGAAVQQLIAREVGADAVAVDVGANVGWHTLALARRVGPGGRVYALEPDARAFELLGRAVWPWPQIEARQVAAADYSGWATLHLAPIDQGDHRIVPSGEERQRLTVRAVSLDDLLADAPRVDFVKISAGGAEVLVLRGLRRTLSRHPGVGVLCAVAPALLERAGAGADTLFALLQDAGLTPHRINSDGTSEPIAAAMAWSLARARGRAPIYFRAA